MTSSFIKHYRFSLILLGSLAAGSLLGLFLKEDAQRIKFIGDIFLNLLFTVVVPLVFFSISSAVANISSTRRLGKILAVMLGLFLLTGVIASLVMVAGVILFSPAQGLSIQPLSYTPPADTGVTERIVAAFTVTDFIGLFSRKNMLALILFAMLIGLAASAAKERGDAFRRWLIAGNEVMMQMIRLVMTLAPLGLGAYFAYLVGVFGPDLLGTYGRAMALYYPLSLIYFFGAFSFYIYLAGGWPLVKLFWPNIIPTSLTALGTGSSVAAIPANLQAAAAMNVPEDIREVVIPIGSTIHMDGSCLSAVLKIAVLFGIFGMDFTGPGTVITAVGIAILSGTVMSGIPGGGFLGEMLIVSLYGFPPEALPVAAMIGTLVDPPATMVNAVGDNAVSILTARILAHRSLTDN